MSLSTPFYLATADRARRAILDRHSYLQHVSLFIVLFYMRQLGGGGRGWGVAATPGGPLESFQRACFLSLPLPPHIKKTFTFTLPSVTCHNFTLPLER